MAKLILLLSLLISVQQLTAQVFQRIEQQAGFGDIMKNNGVAVADYDNDHDLDIFIVSKEKDLEFKQVTKSKLFRNNGNGSFTDVTEASGLTNLLLPEETNIDGAESDGFKNGVSWGDYDNDGFPDIFFTHSTKVQLFHNEGDGSFKDVTAQSGILSYNNCANTGATWFDANNDGYLDLYISDWGGCGSNYFYLNNTDGTFKDATEAYFGQLKNKNTFMSIPFDFNKDGWMDLYVTQDFEEHNDVFVNQGGKGFKEESQLFNLDHVGEDMGMAIGDFNNDGYFDFYIAAINTNPLLTNNGDNSFNDLAPTKNVMKTGWSWGPIFEDFDLDGDEDLFITNGYKLDIPEQQTNVYFKNNIENGIQSFADVSKELGFTDAATSVTPVAFDYDNDGDLDLFVSNSDKEAHFFENKTIDGTNPDLKWFKVILRGTNSNRDAIGTIVRLKTNIGNFHRYNSSINYLSQSLKPLHFGLNGANKIIEVEIQWPSGLIEKHKDFEPNNAILFTEGEGFENYNSQKAKKVKGCTNPLSCNYNPEAVIDDGSCSFLPTHPINGSINSTILKTEWYTYQGVNKNHTFLWQISGGEIIEGHNTNRIKVKWGVSKNASISVREVGENCTGETAFIQVTLNANKSDLNQSVARLWNEALLEAIRKDLARPTIHARNLFHTSIALYDSWAIFSTDAKTYLIGNTVHNYKSEFNGFNINSDDDIEIIQEEVMSYAAYKLLSHRFKNSPGAIESQERFDFLMSQLGYDTTLTSFDYSKGDPWALGNFIAKTIIEYGNSDGSRENSGYDNAFYEPSNPSLFPVSSGNPFIKDPNRWQPLNLVEFVDQSGNLIQGSRPDFLSPEWGNVNTFSLKEKVKKKLNRDGNTFTVYHDPSAPPYLDINTQNDLSDAYKWGFSLVSIWGAHLDPTDNVLWDISPKSIGNVESNNFPENFIDYHNFYNNIEGGDIGRGHNLNPVTRAPYQEQLVPRGDYARVLAEFWADGPDSETPPGHWFTLLNYVNDHKLFEKKLAGEGEVLSPLEWDVKSYFLLGGTMHDAAIAAWSIKGYYDYIRPISAIRYMASLGQSTDASKNNYNIAGLPLIENYIEIVEAGDPLQGINRQNVGKIKLYTWRGPDYINKPSVDMSGVGWILAENWWPYQRPNFVTPPFAGYVSGHSTYSRAAAELMTSLTGDAYFPGGYGEFIAHKNEFLVFEEGPSVDVKLQWATYRDASDQCSLSRIWGGIHPPADDIPGRVIGKKIGVDAYNFGISYFTSEKETHKNHNESQNVIFYPNPTSNILNVSGPINFKTISIYDILGNLVIDFIDDDLIDLSSLAKGVYILKTDSGICKKIIKN